MTTFRRVLLLLAATIAALSALAPAGARADTEVPVVQGRMIWQFDTFSSYNRISEMTLVTAEPGATTYVDCLCADNKVRTVPASGVVNYKVPIRLHKGVLMQIVVQETPQREMVVGVTYGKDHLKTDFTCWQIDPDPAKDVVVPCYTNCPDGVAPASPTDPCATANTRTRIDHAGVRDSLSYGSDGTKFVKLTVSKMPQGSTLLVFCDRNGLSGNCPAYLTPLLPHGGRVDVARHLRHARLSPGTQLELWLYKPNYISDVLRYTIRRNRLPKVERLCLTPAQDDPSRCP